jgi:hypothetical protein
VEKEVKLIVVPLNQVLRKDLSVRLRSTITEKLNPTVCKYSDFACIFSFVVQLAMKTFAISDGDPLEMDALIPTEFQRDSTPVVLPAPIKNPSNNDADYKALFSVSRLQVISSLNFGVVGIQQQTRNNHSPWVNIQELGSGNR